MFKNVYKMQISYINNNFPQWRLEPDAQFELRVQYPLCDTPLRKNNRNSGGDGKMEGCRNNCCWDGAMSAAYIGS